MGAFSDYFEKPTAPPPPAPGPESIADAASRGLRSGLSSAGASLNQLAGLGGEVVGANDFAQDRYAAARQGRAQAEAEAPEINSLGQIRNVDTGLRYLAGQAGAIAPIGAAAIATSVATGNPITGGLLALGPLAAGDIAERQQADPEVANLPAAQRGLRAVAGGALAGLAQTAGPALLANRLVGRAATTAALPAAATAAARPSVGNIVARNLGESVAVNAGGNAAAEGISQFSANPDKPLDASAIGESAAVGAVLGVPFGALGAGADVVRTRSTALRGGVEDLAGRTSDAASGLVNKVRGTVASAADAAPVKVKSVLEEAQSFFNRSLDNTGVADRIISGEPLVDLKTFATEQGQRFSDGEYVKRATEFGRQLLDDVGISPEVRQQATDALASVGDRTSQVALAGLKKAQDLGRATSAKIDSLSESFQEGRASGSAAAPKLSADFSGTNRAITDTLAPLLRERPDLTQRPESVTKLADSVRQAVNALPNLQLNSDTLFRLIDVLGDKTRSTLADAYRAVKNDDPARAESFFSKLNEVTALQERSAKLQDLVGNSLTPEAKSTIAPAQYGELARTLVRAARDGVSRKGAGPAEQASDNARFRQLLSEQFGDKADAISLAVEREARLGRPKDVLASEEAKPAGGRFDEEALFDEQGNRLEAETLDTLRFGLSKPDSRGNSRSVPGGEPYTANSRYAKQHSADLRAKYPDREVRFQPVEGDAEGRGFLVAEKRPGFDEFTTADIDGFRLDTKRYSTSTDRINVPTESGGLILDARRITRTLDKQLPYSQDGQPRNQRLADVFFQGIAKLQQQYGAFDVPDSVVLGKVGDKDFTYGDARKIDRRTAADKSADADATEIARLREQYVEEKDPGIKAVLKKDYEALAGKRESRKAKELNADPDARKSDAKDELARKPSKDDQIAVAAQLGDNELINRSNLDGTPRSTSDAPSGINLKPAIAVAVSLRASDNAVAQKIGARLTRLIAERGKLSEADQAKLQTVSNNQSPSEVAAIINPIARKYADVLVPDAQPTARSGAATRAADSGRAVPPEPQRVARREVLAREEPPSPKELAAKKAALLQAASSSDPALLQELATTSDAKGLQRAAALLPRGKASDAANARLGVLAQDENVALSLQTRKYSQEPQSLGKNGSSRTDTAQTRAAVGDYINRVLGNSVKVAFKKLAHAGEFDRTNDRTNAGDIIRVSVTALDPLSTAHHEALHGFFAQLRDGGGQDITRVLDKAAGSTFVLNQLKDIYKGQPSVLKQLRDPEERSAYAYQHWANGSLQVTPASKNAFQRVGDFIRTALGIWSNSDRALAILDYFHSGKYEASGRDVGAAQKALIDSGRNQVLERAKAIAQPLIDLGDALVSTGSGRLRDIENPSLTKLADLIKPLRTEARSGDAGYISAARQESAKRLSKLAGELSSYTRDDLATALDGLQSGVTVAAGPARIVQTLVKQTLRETLKYLGDAGVTVNDLGKDYFPRVYDAHYISKNQQAFRDLLEPHIRSGVFKGNADEVIRSITGQNGNDFSVRSNGPGLSFAKERKLDFLTPQEIAPFLNKDLIGTLSSYIEQSTKKAEWSRRLGDGKLEAILQDAKKEGATPADIQLAEKYLSGIDGTLGANINPSLKRLTGNLIVYQNIRLLPLAAFSSIVDPLGVVVRGGTAADAWGTFKRGVGAIPDTFRKESKRDEAVYRAELVGVIESGILRGALGDVYSQGTIGGTAKQFNDAFFKYNFLEGTTRAFRTGASESAQKFIQRHGDGKFSVHSQRWLDELGLQKGDVQTDGAGNLSLTEADGLTKEQVGRVHTAINQWVDGAVLRPDAADRPVWFNDPHYALFSHLKQFTYSFQKTILARVAHEARQGNYTPALGLTAYVPVILAGDFLKGLIQGGGSQPDWKENWELGDYVGHAVQRAGLLGVGQLGLDAAKDVGRGGVGIGALVGPTVEQFGDAVQLLGGRKQFGPFVLDALPANALYSEAFGSGSGSVSPE